MFSYANNWNKYTLPRPSQISKKKLFKDLFFNADFETVGLTILDSMSFISNGI